MWRKWELIRPAFFLRDRHLCPELPTARYRNEAASVDHIIFKKPRRTDDDSIWNRCATVPQKQNRNRENITMKNLKIGIR